MFTTKQRTFALLLATGLATGIGCTSPDPEGRFDSFVDSTEEDRRIPDMGPIEGGQQVDFSGQYFFSLKTPLNTGDPFYFLSDVTVNEDFTFEITIQPLKTDNDAAGDARADARTPVGEPISGTGTLAEDGTFDVDFGDVAAPGDSNPVTGSDIVAQILIQGTVLGEDSFCGTASGDVTVPIMASIAGSTFGTVPVADGADLNMIEPLVECPEGTLPTEDAGMGDMGGGEDMGGDAGMVDESFYRCPDVDFAGQWTFEFKSSVQSERATIILDVAADPDETKCFSGEVYAASDGTTDLGDVTAIVERDGQLIVRIPNFVIPPGANPLLPDGGTSNITAIADGYTDDGACGGFDTVVEPLGLAVSGTWSMLRDQVAGFTYDADLTVSGCQAIIPDAPCAFTDSAAAYNLQFITQTQQMQGGDPTETVLTLNANPLTCLSGILESATTEDLVLAYIVSAEDDGNGNLQINGRNFRIPPGGNPLFADGAWGDIPFVTTTLNPGADMCGTMAVEIFDPFTIASNGTFAGVVGGDPAGPACP